MSVTFSLFVCSGLNVLCCFRPTDSAEEPEIIYRPAATTLEPLERPTMQLALDLPASVTTTQIRSNFLSSGRPGTGSAPLDGIT